MCTRPESSPDAPGVCLQHVQLTKGTFRVAPTQLLTNQRLWQERGANRSVEHRTFCADPQEGSCSCPSSGETQVLREAAAGSWEPPGTRKDASSLRISRGRGSRVIGCLRRLAAASSSRGAGGGGLVSWRRAPLRTGGQQTGGPVPGATPHFPAFRRPQAACSKGARGASDARGSQCPEQLGRGRLY